ncbi:hypothetical protein BPAE_0038g00310 [Botrytis paeoniae]|uniref:Uncharacterized protein n=1 Tax=Botrytis paeoniae TaxID=278948 RepID=A0A4Z1FT36_9HELO|nr:hypothetical protein BPAE_0038g00310 [Botrytis paeoniae]
MSPLAWIIQIEESPPSFLSHVKAGQLFAPSLSIYTKMRRLSQLESFMKTGVAPLVTLIADITLVQGSEAKSISYQKFNWQAKDSDSSCVDSTDPVNFVPTPSLFNEQLAIIPSETSTRVVLLNCFDEELALRSAFSTTYEILEAKYDANIKFDLDCYGSDPFKNSRGNIVRQIADTVVQSFISNWNDVTNLNAQSNESNPIELLLFLIGDLETYFLYHLGKLKYEIQCWLDPEREGPSWLEIASPASKDRKIAELWSQSRGIIEGLN